MTMVRSKDAQKQLMLVFAVAKRDETILHFKPSICQMVKIRKLLSGYRAFPIVIILFVKASSHVFCGLRFGLSSGFAITKG